MHNFTAEEHTKCGDSDPVHASERIADIDSDGQAERRHDNRLVTEGQTMDDIGSSTSFASVSQGLDGTVKNNVEKITACFLLRSKELSNP